MLVHRLLLLSVEVCGRVIRGRVLDRLAGPMGT
jgi:hypothetical protein